MPVMKKDIPAGQALLQMREAGVPFEHRMAVVRAAGGVAVPAGALARAMRVRADEEDVAPATDDEKRKLRAKKKKADAARKRLSKKKTDDDEEKKDDKDEDLAASIATEDAIIADWERRIEAVERQRGIGEHAVDPRLQAMAAFGREGAQTVTHPDGDDVFGAIAEQVETQVISAIENALDPNAHARKMLVRCQQKLARMNKEVG
jgi:hypothetical protein